MPVVIQDIRKGCRINATIDDNKNVTGVVENIYRMRKELTVKVDGEHFSTTVHIREVTSVSK